MLNAQIKNLAVVFIVADLARTHRFYAQTLGLAFEVEDFENGYLQARLPGDVEFVFLRGEAPRGATPPPSQAAPPNTGILRVPRARSAPHKQSDCLDRGYPPR